MGRDRAPKNRWHGDKDGTVSNFNNCEPRARSRLLGLYEVIDARTE